MSTVLTQPIAAYFGGKNRYDIDAMLAPFAAAAVVKDEGAERRGLPAVRAWMEETTRKYRDTVEVVDVAEAGGRTVVSGVVSGTFPGSRVSLRFHFTIEDDRIARLEIG